MPVTVRAGSDGFLAVVGSLNLRAVAAAEGELLLHAGAVSRAYGGAVALAGPSGSGKSTLTAVLAQRGAAYLTDETVCLAPEDLRITPFRKPLSLKRGSWSVLPDLAPRDDEVDVGSSQWFVAPDALGAGPVLGMPLLPELVVLPTFVAGAPVQTERLGQAEAAYLLGGNSVRLAQVRGGGLAALARLARRAPAYRVVHGDVRAAADAVMALWDDVA